MYEVVCGCLLGGGLILILVLSEIVVNLVLMIFLGDNNFCFWFVFFVNVVLFWFILGDEGFDFCEIGWDIVSWGVEGLYSVGVVLYGVCFGKFGLLLFDCGGWYWEIWVLEWVWG